MILTRLIDPDKPYQLKAALAFVNFNTASNIDGATFTFARGDVPWRYLSLPLGSPGATLAVALGWVKNSPRVMYEFTYQRLTVDERTRLDHYIGQVHGENFQSLSQSARLSYIEVAFDFAHVSYSNFIFVDPSLKGERRQLAKKGTTYLGSLGAAREEVCYDRRKRLMQRTKPPLDLGYEQLRIEVKLKRPQIIGLNALSAIELPIASLFVVDKEKLANLKLSEARTFAARVLKYDWSPRVAYGKEPNRKKLRQQFEQCRPDWFDRSKLWSRYPEALDFPLNDYFC